jgi:DNA-directed RNA polymerase subunit RPC12/RpoP
VGQGAGAAYAGGDMMTHDAVACTHCGSVKTQEARRTVDRITFRCLHCWKTFTQPLLLPLVTAPTSRGDDAA